VLDQSIFGAILAGALSFLSPCILPLVPAYLCFLTGVELGTLQAHPDKPVRGSAPAQPPDIFPANIRKRSINRAFFFVMGFATVFVALGATASAMGRFVAAWFDVLAVLAGAMLIVMGLHFVGVFRIGLLYREARFQPSVRQLGPAGAYVAGLAFAFGWTPCVGPVLAAILMTAGAQESITRGIILLGAYAAGIGIPFLLAALFVGPFLRFAAKFRRYLGMVEKIMGLALIATGLLFATGSMPVIGNWLLIMFPVFSRIG
jgi:cytochrome c-type biogenesis protein